MLCENLSSDFQTRFDKNQGAQQQMMAGGLKFRIYKIEELYYLCTMYYAFIFAYAKSRFIHEVAVLMPRKYMTPNFYIQNSNHFSCLKTCQKFQNCYHKVPIFLDARKTCCNQPKVYTTVPNLRVLNRKAANSEDPDQTAPL